MQPKSGVGEFLGHLLENEPYLFEEAVDAQITLLVEQVEAAQEQPEVSDESALVLYQRMEEVKMAERRRAVSDIMYYSILNKFGVLGVNLVEPSQLHGIVNLGPTNLTALTKGVHSGEALEMVRTHLMAILGPAMPQDSGSMYSTAAKMSKLQGAQMYAASLMFGYFLRRVDKRFQLERSTGTLRSTEETVRMLEDLFNSAEDAEMTTSDPDEAPVTSDETKAPSLKEYIESFDQEKLVETASLLSIESVALVQEYESVLFGNLQKLQQEMMDVVGEDATSAEDLMKRVMQAVEDEAVETLTISYADQRRLVLEAVAFGSFLRDSESYIEMSASVPLLTAAPPMGQPPMGQ
ncbi:hypothetical protein CYMTET_38135 [Cymbomonas tetramitiformis]|uniref:Uncharacterized protein n=1 Tax=Cymbomonas tetramitiformis TaxID=36881 RepID=A0AAE0F5Z4_9CHLO|nr:hypothetical protein CYMTET_38135 [Cymbomonas tetramitiformis]